MSSAAKTVKFSGLRKTQEVALPSIDGSAVEVYTSLIVAEQREMQAKWPKPAELNEKEKTDMTVWMCIKAIKKWNLVDDNEQPLPIDDAIMNKLTLVDILTIMEVVTGQKLLEDGKPLQGGDTDKKKVS